MRTKLDKVYLPSDRVLSRKMVDELILVPAARADAEMENLYTLNDLGARVYELIDGRRTGREICAAIAEEFELSQDQAEADVSLFLEKLMAIDGIEERGELE